MSAFLGIRTNGKARQAALNKILMKSVDFLICNKDFSVVSAIELQDKTHDRPDRRRSDKFKRNALKSAEIRLIEYHAANLPTVEEIRNDFFHDKAGKQQDSKTPAITTKTDDRQDWSHYDKP
ncbi:MAG: DUF2726 domain-containing protein [Azoarcus sp.]|jgi:hypothetical protein|nr:DUF2726 domain-containing protein [Azoarcus sp.]